MTHFSPGDVYFGDFGEPSKWRPVVVVSRLELNGGTSVVVVPFTSQKFAQRSRLPYCVPFLAGEAGLTVDSVAKVDEITALRVRRIDTQSGRIGRISATHLRQILAAVKYVVGDE